MKRRGFVTNANTPSFATSSTTLSESVNICQLNCLFWGHSVQTSPYIQAWSGMGFCTERAFIMPSLIWDEFKVRYYLAVVDVQSGSPLMISSADPMSRAGNLTRSLVLESTFQTAAAVCGFTRSVGLGCLLSERQRNGLSSLKAKDWDSSISDT